MKLKEPLCCDTSYYKIIKDFNLITPKPYLFITKATEGVSIVDSTFYKYFTSAVKIGAFRGAYHFNRKAVSALQQANHFLEVLDKVDVLKTDILFLDVEEGGEKASQLWVWIETVKQKYPDNLIMIYSRKNILDAIPMTQGEKDYFRKIKIWTAGYPFFPDLFSKVPSGYTPDKTKYGEVWLWQYGTPAGLVSGISGDLDINWVSPQLQEYLGTFSLGEQTMASYEGSVTTIAKLWDSIGGNRVYFNGKDLPVGQKIAADSLSGDYIHLTSPISAWSKKEWFNYHEVGTTPPPPPPPPPAQEPVHTIDIYPDGKIAVDHGNPY